MRILVSLAIVWVASALNMQGQTNRTGIDLLAPVKYSTEWKPHPEWYQSVLTEKPNAPILALGHKEFVVRGPLVESFRPSRTTASDDFIDGKLRRIPILSLIVPYKMPTAPGTKTKYFRWRGEASLPWHSVTQVAPAGASGDNRIHVQPSGSLISVGF